MKVALPWLDGEGAAMVESYGWFMGPNTGPNVPALINTDGKLTALGQCYINGMC